LVNPGFFYQAQNAHCFQNAQGAHGIYVGHVFGAVEAYAHVAHGPQVVNLVGLHLLHNADDVGRVAQVAVVQVQAHRIVVRVLVQVVDPLGVEQRAASLDAVYLVAFF
jgi:hypothetical protein